jgi:hypothetical protein
VSRGQTFAIIAAMVATAVIGRLVPHMPNFAPVTASALFCGAFMTRKQSFLALALILLISDYSLLYIKPFGATSFAHFYMPWQLYHSTLPFIYLSFAISAAIGWCVASMACCRATRWRCRSSAALPWATCSTRRSSSVASSWRRASHRACVVASKPR